MSGWDALIGALIGGGAATGGGALVAWRERLRAHRVDMYNVHLPALSEHWPEIISAYSDATFDAARRCTEISSNGDRRNFALVRRSIINARRAERYARSVRDELGGREDPEAMSEPMQSLHTARLEFNAASLKYAEWLERRLSLSGAVGYRRWRWRYKRITGEDPDERFRVQ